jgi:exonuclease SbcD
MSGAIKLLHLADVHIGMENYGRVDPETGWNSRLKDFLDTLDEAVERAIREPVDLVVISGDIYKSRDPSPTHQREFARRIYRLSQAGIQVFIVAGNHDLPLATGRATSVDIFQALAVPNVTVARRIERHCLATRSGPVQVIALPWLLRSQVLAKDEYKNQTIEELNRKMAQVAEELLRGQAAELDPRLPAVLVGHAHVASARVGAERLLTVGQEPAFSLQMFDLPHVAYVALGHIHRHQQLTYSSPRVVYAGSLNRVDFSEAEEEKGFVLAEVQPGRAEIEFVPVRARPFVLVEARADGDNPTDRVIRAIERAGGLRGAVVKVCVAIQRERLAEFKEAEVRAQLREAAFVAPFEYRYERDSRLRVSDPQAFQGASPLEALEIYFETKNVPVGRRAVLMEYARRLAAAEPPPAE